MRTGCHFAVAALALLLMSVSAPPAAAAAPVEVAVYAAASLKEVFLAIQPICEGPAGGRVVLIFNFGASNDLARQIVAANKADVFFPADEAWMDHVAREGLIDAATRRSLLSNRLVVVVPADSDFRIASAADLAAPAVRRLALANTDAVPAGRYAKAWLEKTGAWDGVRERVVPFPDVRATLAAVESGGVDAGVVYRTDAVLSRRARVAFIVPEDEGPRISYSVAALRDRPNLEQARRVVECIAGKEAGTVFERFGFVVNGPTP